MNNNENDDDHDEHDNQSHQWILDDHHNQWNTPFHIIKQFFHGFCIPHHKRSNNNQQEKQQRQYYNTTDGKEELYNTHRSRTVSASSGTTHLLYINNTNNSTVSFDDNDNDLIEYNDQYDINSQSSSIASTNVITISTAAKAHSNESFYYNLQKSCFLFTSSGFCNPFYNQKYSNTSSSKYDNNNNDSKRTILANYTTTRSSIIIPDENTTNDSSYKTEYVDCYDCYEYFDDTDYLDDDDNENNIDNEELFVHVIIQSGTSELYQFYQGFEMFCFATLIILVTLYVLQRIIVSYHCHQQPFLQIIVKNKQDQQQLQQQEDQDTTLLSSLFLSLSWE